MNKPLLFGVRMPRITRAQLLQSIDTISHGSRTSLYFLYSEFLLRANRNPSYKHVLNQANLSAIDGVGTIWALKRILKTDLLITWFQKTLNWWWLFRLPIFAILFFLQLILNFVDGARSVVGRKNMTAETNTELILGRDFVYELLAIALEKSWKTLIIGGDGQNQVKAALENLFPGIQLEVWSRPSDSSLMRDRLTHESLDLCNLYEYFPDLQDAKETIKNHRPDLVLVCIGGASGKQEFFIHDLVNSLDLSFTLAVSLGAALDHLGAGAKQEKAPEWMVKSGLEWVFRFIKQPYRRLRIFDSIFTLYWWTTLQEFIQRGKDRPTVVNIVKNTRDQFLLVKRRRGLITGDLKSTFVQGGIDEKNPYQDESIIKAGIRELTEEAHLEASDLQVLAKPIKSEIETMTISLRRFLVLQAAYYRQNKYLNFMYYTGKKEPRANWENQSAMFVDRNEVTKLLSTEKLQDWERAQKYI